MTALTYTVSYPEQGDDGNLNLFVNHIFESLSPKHIISGKYAMLYSISNKCATLP
jgi:hypothetical protein